MKLRFLHTADLHLDSPFQGLNDQQAAQRRQEQRRLLEQLAALAAREKVHLILLSGDLLDSACAYRETIYSLEQCFTACDCRVFIAPGNHDWYGGRSPWRRLNLPENVHLFTEPVPEAITVPELGVRVWGAAFRERESAGILQDFSIRRQPRQRELMVLHGDLNPNSPYNPITEAQIAASGLDYLALGHIHSASGLRRAGNTFYAWPGCPEGRGFDECGEKGVYLGTMEEDGRVQLRFCPLGGRQYHRERLDITDADDVAGMLSQLLHTGGAGDIWRVYLTGESAFPPNLSGLTAALQGLCFALELRDETRPRRELWELAETDSLRGMFLRKLRLAYDRAESDTQREQIMQAVRWGLAALDGGEELRP